MQPTFILLSGLRFSGKNYIANRITRETGWAQASFADAVKDECAARYGLDAARLKNDREYKEQHRTKLIELGNTRRAEDPDYWVRRVYDTHNTPGAVYVLCDYRFPNEAAFLRSMKACVITVRIQASDDIRRERGWKPDPAVDTDISETSLLETRPDFLIINDVKDAFMPEMMFVIIAEASRRRVRMEQLQ